MSDVHEQQMRSAKVRLIQTFLDAANEAIVNGMDIYDIVGVVNVCLTTLVTEHIRSISKRNK